MFNLPRVWKQAFVIAVAINFAWRPRHFLGLLSFACSKSGAESGSLYSHTNTPLWNRHLTNASVSGLATVAAMLAGDVPKCPWPKKIINWKFKSHKDGTCGNAAMLKSPSRILVSASWTSNHHYFPFCQLYKQCKWLWCDINHSPAKTIPTLLLHMVIKCLPGKACAHVEARSELTLLQHYSHGLLARSHCAL